MVNNKVNRLTQLTKLGRAKKNRPSPSKPDISFPSQLIMYASPQPGTYTRKPHNGPRKFVSDPLNSTYRWQMQMTAGHPENSDRCREMVGYSCGEGAENPNKVLLLNRKIINPVCRYIYKTDVITIYQQIPGVPPEFHVKLIDLYRREFELFSWVKDDPFISLFLKNLYSEYLVNGKMPPEEDRRKNARKDVYFAELDHSKLKFATHAQLVDYCKVKIEKFSRECMRGFYQAHRDFQPELFETDVREAIAHAVHTAPSAEAAQAAQTGQASLNAMHQKFPSNRGR